MALVALVSGCFEPLTNAVAFALAMQSHDQCHEDKKCGPRVSFAHAARSGRGIVLEKTRLRWPRRARVHMKSRPGRVRVSQNAVAREADHRYPHARNRLDVAHMLPTPAFAGRSTGQLCV